MCYVLMKKKTIATGRAILPESGSTIASALNSTSDQSKVNVIFCEQLLCDYFGHGLQMCYCCPIGDKKEFCHLTMAECRAVCPVCNPRCPTQHSIQSTQNFP